MSKREMSWSSSSDPSPARWALRRLAHRDRKAAMEHLARRARDHLFLLDLAAQLGLPPAPGELAVELVGLWRGGELAAVASLRPTIAVEVELDPEVLEGLLPALRRVEAGLVKTPAGTAEPLWRQLRSMGRRGYLDRTETAFAVTRGVLRPVSPASDRPVRPARAADLTELTGAARASLREEGRPDPFEGDREGFRRWVRGRLDRARVVEHGGRVGFVAYADVRRPEGWLLQGVYTRPEVRRLGLAAAGVTALCREAFAAGTDHVQLSVVEGNTAAERLYAKLGFRSFGRLRTILFN